MGLAGGGGHHLADGLVGEPCQISEQLAVIEKIGPEHLGDGKNPLAVRNVGENLVLKHLGENRRTLGTARRTEPPGFAGEGHEKLETAPWTNDAGETRFEQATIEILVDGSFVEASPETVSPFESLLPLDLDGVETAFEELIERRDARVAGAINDRGFPPQGDGQKNLPPESWEMRADRRLDAIKNLRPCRTA